MYIFNKKKVRTRPLKVAYTLPHKSLIVYNLKVVYSNRLLYMQLMHFYFNQEP